MPADVVDPLPYPAPAGWDEMCDVAGEVRPHWRYLLDAYTQLGGAELERRRRELRRLLHDDGVTYTVHGEGVRRAWELDPVPLLVGSDEWRSIEQGVLQRTELLDLVLADLYGPRELVRKGLLPPELIYDHPGFVRAAGTPAGAPAPRLVVTACDLARDATGQLWVLGDRCQAPSGMGYALENRIVTTRVFPSVFRDAHVHRLAPFFRALRGALLGLAPEGRDNPLAVILTPGPWNETFFEHAYLATYLGFPLVQGGDLEVRNGAVWLRSVGEPERVDVVLRRVDEGWCDPLELHDASTLGVPGLMEMVRRRAVGLANPIGSGVLEHPGLAAFLPALARHLLGQDLYLPSVPTWWCGDPASASHADATLERLVLRCADDHGERVVVGASLGAAARDDLRREVAARPWRWTAQELPSLSTAPVLAAGALVARPTVLRTFAAAHEGSFLLLPGGLTRVGSDDGLTLVTNQAGATSKDTWVLASEPESQVGFLVGAPAQVVAALDPAHAVSSRVAENLFWMARYAERCEATVRLVRVVLDRRNDTAGRWNPTASESLAVLLAALTHSTGVYPGFVGEGAAERIARPEGALRELLIDDTRPGTLAHDIGALLSSATAVRDQLSLDTWLVLNDLEDALGELGGGGPRHLEPPAGLPAATRSALGDMVGSLLALGGLVNESMVRDAGWQFLEVGRRIERALLVLGLVRATLGDVRSSAVDGMVFESMLTSAESIVTYRRRATSRLDLTTLLDLLLADEGNPRSVAYQLARLSESVGALPRARATRRSEEEKLVLEARAKLALVDAADLARADGQPALGGGEADGEPTAPEGARRSALLALVTDLELLLAEAADAVQQAHFPARPGMLLVGTAR